MATTKGTGRTEARTGTRTPAASSRSIEKAKPAPSPVRVAATRARAGRKIQKKMPVIWEDGSVSRPSARGSKAVQPPPARGPITSRLPLSRGTDGLANVATAAIQEFWEKFHHYHRLQAELEKLYLWFEEFEQVLKRDNQELDRVLSGVQSIYRPPAEVLGKPIAKRPARARAAAVEPDGTRLARGSAVRRGTPVKSR